jgi:hypothetical protein
MMITLLGFGIDNTEDLSDEIEESIAIFSKKKKKKKNTN